MTLKKSIMVAVAIAAISAGSSTYAEVAVVVGSSSPLNELSSGDTKKIFLGKSNKFPGGGSATPIDLDGGNATRDHFYTQVVGKKPAQIKAYWSKRVFTGKGNPPKSIADDTAVKSWLSSNPGSVGYIDAASVDDSVKALLQVP